MTTIREVAEKANVSSSTVSHVINNTRYVSEETRARVMDAMRELNYTPNRLARSLRSKDMRTNTIGLLIPDSANPFFAEVSRGVEDACFEEDYNVILCNSDDEQTKELEYLHVLLSKQVDGIILVSASGKGDTLEFVNDRGATVVAVDRAFDETFRDSVDSVLVDNESGGYEATRYLLDLGHTRIGCISGPSLLRPSAGRVHGYRQALADAGIEPDPSLVIPGDFRPQSGYEAAQQLLKLSDPLPSAIFACNDMMAMGALCAIHESGLKTPEDISLVGFDDIDLAYDRFTAEL
jgi:LacI family transcriptional regulator